LQTVSDVSYFKRKGCHTVNLCLPDSSDKTTWEYVVSADGHLHKLIYHGSNGTTVNHIEIRISFMFTAPSL